MAYDIEFQQFVYVWHEGLEILITDISKTERNDEVISAILFLSTSYEYQSDWQFVINLKEKKKIICLNSRTALKMYLHLIPLNM